MCCQLSVSTDMRSFSPYTLGTSSPKISESNICKGDAARLQSFSHTMQKCPSVPTACHSLMIIFGIFWWVGRNGQTWGGPSSQNLASISSCARLSESPTSRTMLRYLDPKCPKPESGCFFPGLKSKAGWRKVNPLELCVLWNIPFDVKNLNPRSVASVCSGGVNLRRPNLMTMAQ